MFSPSLMGTTIIVFCDFVYCYYVIICKIHTPFGGFKAQNYAITCNCK